MNMFLEKLKQYMSDHPLDLSRSHGDTILEMLYECYDEINGMDNAEIKQDFEEVYRLMNGKSLKEIDALIYPICKPYRDHQKSGFAEGVRIGYSRISKISKMYFFLIDACILCNSWYNY